MYNLFMEIQYSFYSYIIRLICSDLDLMNSVLVEITIFIVEASENLSYCLILNSCWKEDKNLRQSLGAN